MPAKRHLPACFIAAILISNSSAAEFRVPDHSSTIQSAIDRSAPGDVIIVAPGTYREQLRLKPGVTLRSAGDDAKGETGLLRAEKTILDGGGRAPVVAMAEGSELDGFTVTRAGEFDQARFDRHHETRGENLRDEEGAAGVVGGSSAIEVTNVTARITHCIVHDNGHPGIALSGDTNRSVIFANRVFRNMGGGIGVANGARPLVSENHCSQNLRGGIGCRNSAPLLHRNRCFNNVRAGIGIREGATTIALENECFENRRAGIGVRMPGTSPLLRENRCYRNGMAGIGCRNGASPVIVKNKCFENRLAGIGAMDNARPVLVENHIHANEAAAIGLDASDSGEAWVFGNTIRAKQLVAMGVRGGWTVTAAENEFSREGGMPPLVMVFEGASASFSRNRFQFSGIAAIRSAGRVFVSGNRFENTAGKGPPARQAVWALPGSMASVSGDNEYVDCRVPNPPAVTVANRTEWIDALREATPGTTILVAPGEYEGGLYAENLRGTAQRPIVISAADPRDPPLIRGGTSGIHLKSPRHVELRHIRLDGAKGNGINIDDGGRVDSPALGILLDHLVIENVGSGGNQDGIKMSGVSGFRISGCRVARWGEKGSAIDLVGCHDGTILDSSFSHTPGMISGSGVQAKGGSSRIAIRHCRFENASSRAVNLGGSTGLPYFRPAETNAEAREVLVEDCTFSGSLAPVAFVGSEDCVVRHCTLNDPEKWFVRILQENTGERFIPCRNGRFEFNRLLFDAGKVRTAVNIGSNTRADSFRFIGNVLVCRDRPGVSLPFPGTSIGNDTLPEQPSAGPEKYASGIRW